MSLSGSKGFAALERLLNSDREVLRRRLLQGIKRLNHGDRVVSRHGIRVDVVREMERFLGNASDEEVHEARLIMEGKYDGP